LFCFFIAGSLADFYPGEVANKFGVVGLHFSGTLIVVGGFGKFAGGFHDQAQIVARLGLIGHEFDRVFKFPGGHVEGIGMSGVFVDLLVKIDEAEVVAGGAEHRVGVDGFMKQRFGVVVFFLLDERVGLLRQLAREGGVGAGGVGDDEMIVILAAGEEGDDNE